MVDAFLFTPHLPVAVLAGGPGAADFYTARSVSVDGPGSIRSVH